MSRVARLPVKIPPGVEVDISAGIVRVKGKKGELRRALHPQVALTRDGDAIRVAPTASSKATRMLAGTTRALLQSMVTGVTNGYERKLEIVGVGYRAQIQGKVLNLTVGMSHPVRVSIPDGITVETPSQTEIVVRGADKRLVGQLAANIRAFRPPEPYKGKGIRYADEHVIRKEAKKA